MYTVKVNSICCVITGAVMKYLAFRMLVHDHSQDKGSHCTILKLHRMIRENLNKVLVSAILDEVTLAGLQCMETIVKGILHINRALTGSTARILAQMKTKIGCSSLSLLPKSFNTYGKIPTERAELTAHGPRSRNLPNSSKAWRRWA